MLKKLNDRASTWSNLIIAVLVVFLFVVLCQAEEQPDSLDKTAGAGIGWVLP